MDSSYNKYPITPHYSDKGGCFSGDNYVTTTRGEKKIEDLKEGDYVKSTKDFVKIKHVVKIKKGSYMYVLSGLIITGTHPIFLPMVGWVKPKDHTTEIVTREVMYNLVLESEHNILINDIPCVTWGHDCKGELAHKFYGSSFEIENALCGLKKEDGQIIVGGFAYKDKHVIGFTS